MGHVIAQIMRLAQVFLLMVVVQGSGVSVIRVLKVMASSMVKVAGEVSQLIGGMHTYIPIVDNIHSLLVQNPCKVGSSRVMLIVMCLVIFFSSNSKRV